MVARAQQILESATQALGAGQVAVLAEANDKVNRTMLAMREVLRRAVDGRK